MKVFDSKLREIRLKRGISQVELAEMIGVSRQTINRLEKATNNTSLEVAYRLSDALDLPLTKIFVPSQEMKVVTLKSETASLYREKVNSQ